MTDSKLKTPYIRYAIEGITVVLFAGLVLAILGIAAALVYWAWTA